MYSCSKKMFVVKKSELLKWMNWIHSFPFVQVVNLCITFRGKLWCWGKSRSTSMEVISKCYCLGVNSERCALTDEDEEDGKWDNVPVRLEELLGLNPRDDIVELVLKILCQVLVVHLCLMIKTNKQTNKHNNNWLNVVWWFLRDTVRVNLLLNRRKRKVSRTSFYLMS